MTEGIKGTRPAPTPAGSRSESPRREEPDAATDPQPSFEDKVSTRTAEAIQKGTEEAARAVRELETAPPQPPPPSERVEVRPPNPSQERRETEIVFSEESEEAAATEVESSEEPIRTPEEATRVAERVAREIVQNPPQALAVNINLAAVRALFS